jgi:hypothetical protein
LIVWDLCCVPLLEWRWNWLWVGGVIVVDLDVRPEYRQTVRTVKCEHTRDCGVIILWIYGATSWIARKSVFSDEMHTANPPIVMSEPYLVPANRCGTLV